MPKGKNEIPRAKIIQIRWNKMLFGHLRFDQMFIGSRSIISRTLRRGWSKRLMNYNKYLLVFIKKIIAIDEEQNLIS